MVLESRSAEETLEIGRRLGREASGGQIIALCGDLGAGKTVLSGGVAEGLGVTEPVTSPTFTIMQIYESGRLPLFHFDLYRIGEIEEMDEIGYEEYFFGNGVSLVEWADLFPELLPPEAIRVTIRKEREKGDACRRIEILYPEGS